MKRLLLFVIRFYRTCISPLTPPHCRYARRGGWMALRRILRCHPFHKGGYDPVP